MSLRLRLLTVALVLGVTYAVTAWFIVSSHEAELIRQVDIRLGTLPPVVLRESGPGPAMLRPGEMANETANPFSDYYIAFVIDEVGAVPLVVGALSPGAVDAVQAVELTGGEDGIVTIRSGDPSTRFRAIVSSQPEGDGWIVAAQSLEKIDAAVARLARTFWIAGIALSAVLGLGGFWVYRLGLSPIAKVTAVAEAISAGDRSRRVEVKSARTEAGKLGEAFNTMLDERDLSEDRLRQFIADASHELRTPLTSIQGYLELYRQGAFRHDGQMTDVVRRMSAESVRMRELVDDLLTLACLDEGRPRRNEPVDLGQIIRDAAQDSRAVQPERAIAMVAPMNGPVTTGDPAQLTQLVGILVSNALTHTPVSAPLRLEAVVDGADAIVTVIDAGPGIDEAVAARVFDRFWRGQPGRARDRRAGGGAGLGLAIAQAIVEAHGGTIRLESVKGRGASFSVRLPRVESEEAHDKQTISAMGREVTDTPRDIRATSTA